MRLHLIRGIILWYNETSWLVLLLLLSLFLLESEGISIPERMEQNLDTPAPSQQAMSFYKRALPETCIAFASRQGKKLFASAMANGGLKSFFPLIQQFHTQSEPAYCGLATLVLVLNALAVDPRQNWKGPWRWYEEQMLNCCLDLEDVKSTGITLRDFRCLAHCQGLSIDLNYCDTSSLEDFRSAVKRACLSEEENAGDDNDDHKWQADDPQCDEPLSEALVVSYSRKVLGQTGSGHFSPLAAYDPVSDTVLILDTARFKYGAHWAKLPLVYEAMKPLDPDTGRSRGYALLGFHPGVKSPKKVNENVEPADGVQPVSLLFRSKLTQNAVRRKYKEYLESLSSEISWEQTCNYWLSDDHKVWTIVEPLRLPRDDDEGASTVEDIRTFLRELLSSLDPSGLSCCDGAAKTGKCLGEKDAILIIYLASLEESQRKKLVHGFQSKASTLTREQLLNESNIIARAIFFSGESTF